jgi:hypothetical protein
MTKTDSQVGSLLPTFLNASKNNIRACKGVSPGLLKKTLLLNSDLQ